jgi:pSer/pThr/pTyr-binding forkhead associated (FHA) protein
MPQNLCPKPMSEQQRDCHVLVVECEEGSRTVALDAATYSIGRDRKNAIVLAGNTISRQHAILLRLPLPGSSDYCYRIVDGNSAGKPSSNGITVNKQKVRTHDLENGDVIIFGRCVRASYQILPLHQSRFLRYMRFDVLDFQSIKSEPVSQEQTLTRPEELKTASSNTAIIDVPEDDDLPTELMGKYYEFWNL